MTDLTDEIQAPLNRVVPDLYPQVVTHEMESIFLPRAIRLDIVPNVSRLLYPEMEYWTPTFVVVNDDESIRMTLASHEFRGQKASVTPMWKWETLYVQMMGARSLLEAADASGSRENKRFGKLADEFRK